MEDAHGRADIIGARLAGMPVEVQREVISTLMDIRVRRVKNWGRHVFDPTRVEVTPKTWAGGE